MAQDFDRKLFSDLLQRAKGNRSLNDFAKQSGVNSGYLSRLIRGERPNPPSADVIKRIASAARGGVTLEDLMAAAGYLEVDAPPRPLTPQEKLEELGIMLRSEGVTEEDVQVIMDLIESRRKLREAAKRPNKEK